MAYFGSFTSSVDQLGNNYKEFLAKLQLPLPAPTPTDFSPAESDRCHVEDLQDEERDEDGGGESGGEENQNQNNQTNAEEGQQKKANGNKSKKQKVDEPTICEGL
jgi:hypothetical protein